MKDSIIQADYITIIHEVVEYDGEFHIQTRQSDGKITYNPEKGFKTRPAAQKDLDKWIKETPMLNANTSKRTKREKLILSKINKLLNK